MLQHFSGNELFELDPCHGIDEDIDVFNPTDILWAVATRVQPHIQVSILQPLFRGNLLDPSLVDEIKTSGMIIDATRPLDRPFSPVSKCPDDAMAWIKLKSSFPEKYCSIFPWTEPRIGPDAGDG